MGERWVVKGVCQSKSASPVANYAGRDPLDARGWSPCRLGLGLRLRPYAQRRDETAGGMTMRGIHRCDRGSRVHCGMPPHLRAARHPARVVFGARSPPAPAALARHARPYGRARRVIAAVLPQLAPLSVGSETVRIQHMPNGRMRNPTAHTRCDRARVPHRRVAVMFLLRPSVAPGRAGTNLQEGLPNLCLSGVCEFSSRAPQALVVVGRLPRAASTTCKGSDDLFASTICSPTRKEGLTAS